jgi:hypothetical protein
MMRRPFSRPAAAHQSATSGVISDPKPAVASRDEVGGNMRLPATAAASIVQSEPRGHPNGGAPINSIAP